MIYVKTCAECGEEYETHHSNGKFCSRACRVKWFNRQAAEKRLEDPKLHTVVCRTCGKEFLHKNPSVRYCSVECRRAAEHAKRQKQDQTGRKHAEEHRRNVRNTMARLKRKSTVAAVNAAGRAQGLSYGQMMARKDGYLNG